MCAIGKAPVPVRALLDAKLIPTALHVIKPNGTSSWAKEGTWHSGATRAKTHLSTDNACFYGAEAVIADCAQNATVVDLQPSRSGIRSI